MPLKISKERRAEFVASIQRYFSEKREQAISNMEAEFLLDFFLQEIGPPIYNQAVKDAQDTLHRQVGELDAVCFEIEEGYWEKQDA